MVGSLQRLNQQPSGYLRFSYNHYDEQPSKKKNRHCVAPHALSQVEGCCHAVAKAF